MTAVIALAALTYGCIEGGSQGFATVPVITAFTVAAASFAAFVTVQARSAQPMIPLRLFRSGPVAVTLTVAITMAGFYGTVFLQSLYFQQQRGDSALRTGLLFLPMTALVTVISPLVPRIMNRFGRLIPVVAGQVSMTGGLIALALLPAAAPAGAVAAAMMLVGGGGGLTVPPVAALILDSVPSSLGGTASGVLNTFRQMGGSLGVAIFGAVVSASGHFAAGQRTDYLAMAAILAATALISLTLRATQAGQHR